MPITIDATTNSGYKIAVSSYSWDHTISGTKRFLLVSISMLSIPGSTVQSVVFGLQGLKFIGEKHAVAGTQRLEFWGLLAPTIGTDTITVILSTSLDSVGTAVSFMGVDQGVGTEGFNGASGTNVGAADASVNISTSRNDQVVTGGITTTDASVTGVVGTTESNVTGALGTGSLTVTGPQVQGTTTLTWTDVGALAVWTVAGLTIREAGQDRLAPCTM